MPFDLMIPAGFRKARWKVKIREKENREPPHVTVMRDTLAWRIDLRTGQFMDRQPDPEDVPAELVAHIKKAGSWRLLCEQWDRKYPSNPVRGESEED